MPDTTEIYICKNGQALKEGKLVISGEIGGRKDAEDDATRRCQIDPTIDRIAYYAVAEDGAFRNFFTYTNPAATGRTKTARKAAASRRSSPAKKAVKKSWFRRLMSVFD